MTKINYAVHLLEFLEDEEVSPLIRVDTIEEANTQITNGEGSIIVTEISEEQEDKTFLLKEIRIVDCPKYWIPKEYKPEYDGQYLCHLIRDNECGTKSHFQQVLSNTMSEWVLPERCKLTHWMIVSPPSIKYAN